MYDRIRSLFQRLASTDTFIWEEEHKFITPYTLEECLERLQNADHDKSLSHLKCEWLEGDQPLGKYLHFSCKTSRSRVSLGLSGQIEAQLGASNLVRARVGMLYSNVYFFLGFVLIAPLFLASGTQPNLLGSYLVSLLGCYVVTLFVGFIIAQVAIAVFSISSQQLIDDLKLLLKGA